MAVVPVEEFHLELLLQSEATKHLAAATATALLIAPAKPSTTTALESLLKSANFGIATAESIPSITITMINSTKVKPQLFCLRREEDNVNDYFLYLPRNNNQ